MTEQQKVLIKGRLKKFGTHYDDASAAGWHVIVKDEAGEDESWSGPHFSYLMAAIAAKKLGVKM